MRTLEEQVLAIGDRLRAFMVKKSHVCAHGAHAEAQMLGFGAKRKSHARPEHYRL